MKIGEKYRLGLHPPTRKGSKEGRFPIAKAFTDFDLCPYNSFARQPVTVVESKEPIGERVVRRKLPLYVYVGTEAGSGTYQQSKQGGSKWTHQYLRKHQQS